MSEPTVQVSIYDSGNSGQADQEPARQAQPAQPRANDYMHGGTHYKAHKYETWDVILDWNLGYLDGNAVKYLSRWRLKGGVQDLKKARHYIDKLIEVTETSKDG